MKFGEYLTIWKMWTKKTWTYKALANRFKRQEIILYKADINVIDKMLIKLQCLGSGSVRSGRFLLPGSRSTKNMQIHRSGSKWQNIDQKLPNEKIYF